MRYDYWNFIETHLPNYSSSEDVCLSNDISTMLDEPQEASDECKSNVKLYLADLTDREALIDLLVEVDARLFKEALRNYWRMSLFRQTNTSVVHGPNDRNLQHRMPFAVQRH